MKGLFWTKLPPMKLAGTVFVDLDDERAFGAALDVARLEAGFGKAARIRPPFASA